MTNKIGKNKIRFLCKRAYVRVPITLAMIATRTETETGMETGTGSATVTGNGTLRKGVT